MKSCPKNLSLKVNFGHFHSPFSQMCNVIFSRWTSLCWFKFPFLEIDTELLLIIIVKKSYMQIKSLCFLLESLWFFSQNGNRSNLLFFHIMKSNNVSLWKSAPYKLFRDLLNVILNYYNSTFIHCTNSDFLIGWLVPCDTGLWQNNLLDLMIVV